MEHRLLHFGREHLSSNNNSEQRPSFIDRVMGTFFLNGLGNTRSYLGNLTMQEHLRCLRAITPEQRAAAYSKLRLERYTPEERQQLREDDAARLQDIERQLKEYESTGPSESDMLQISHEHAQVISNVIGGQSNPREARVPLFRRSGFSGILKLVRMFLGLYPVKHAADNFLFRTRELLAAEGIRISDDVGSGKVTDMLRYATALNQFFRSQSHYRTLPEYLRGLATYLKEQRRTTVTFEECVHQAQAWTQGPSSRLPH